jgi:phage-related minor tail protein
MASNRIKGITIEIGGNTTQLTKALNDVDKSLKDTQNQLKDVNKLLKLDPSNVELLRQKQDLLGKAVADTKTRQEELTKALEQAKKAGSTEENQKQQDALQRELIETTAQLKDLEKQYNKCSPALEAVSAKTGQMAEKTKGLSKAASVAAAGLVAMTVAAAKQADELQTDANVTGFTVEELQKLKYAADRVDVSYETMTGSITKLTKNMASGSDTFSKLGVSITNADGSMRDATAVWYEAIDALGKVENETERDALSMELFGKSAMEMAGIVDDGGASLRALGEEAEATGTIMSGEAVADTVKFNDAIDQLKATAMQSFMKAGATLAEQLLPALEKLVGWVSKALEWFANLDGTTKTIILTILALVAALSPVLSLISTITAVLPTLSAMFTALSGPVGIVIAAVAALVAIGVALYKNWDTIKAKAQELWANLKTTFEKIKTAITKPIEAARDFVKGVIDKIKSFFQFKVELPKIKLPHFGITPAGWKLGDLLKGSIPKLGITWYAKAMENGMVLDTPTVMPAADGTLRGFGDAGPEVVVGAKSLMSMIRQATGGTGGVQVSVVVNGNVEDYDALAETIGQKLQQQMARAGRAFG